MVDGGSTFAPSKFLDLYFLAEENPRILDLLNVRYLTHSPRQPFPEPAQGIRLPPGAFRRVTLPSPRIARTLEVDSRLIAGRDVPDGTAVAVIHAIDTGGTSHTFQIRAGHETAEWTMDRPGAGVAHRKPPVARSWPMPAEGFEGHSYRASFRLPSGFRLAELAIERAAPDGWLQIEEIRLDGEALRRRAPYRLIRPELYENDAALPRAFLVRRARRVAPERMLEELKHLDPAEEALLTDPLPPGWPTQVPLGRLLPPVRVAEYTPHRVRLETTVTEPVLLILSDTHDRGWQAGTTAAPCRSSGPITRSAASLSDPGATSSSSATGSRRSGWGWGSRESRCWAWRSAGCWRGGGGPAPRGAERLGGIPDAYFLGPPVTPRRGSGA